MRLPNECLRVEEPPPPRVTQSQDVDAQRVRELLRLPAPVLEVSPSRDGLTGLDTWLWVSGFGPPEGEGRCVHSEAEPAAPTCFLDVRLDGRRLEAEARPDIYEWDTGDAGTAARRWNYTTTYPGTKANPAVHHVYETKSSQGRPESGIYTLSLTLSWRARYRVDGGPWQDLGAMRTTSTRPYRVIEVISVLTG